MKLNIFKKDAKIKPSQKKSAVVAKEAISEGVKVVQDKGSASVYQYIVSPYLTEKTSLLNAEGQYAFKVFKKANKIEIKKAVEQLYGVHVENVRIMVIPSKRRQDRK